MPETLKELTSRAFVKNLAPVELERIMHIFLFLANNAGELRTNDGLRLNDSADWRQFFKEVAGGLAERERQVGA